MLRGASCFAAALAVSACSAAAASVSKVAARLTRRLFIGLAGGDTFGDCIMRRSTSPPPELTEKVYMGVWLYTYWQQSN